MIRRPVAGQLYVSAMIALAAVVMATAMSSLQFSRPGLFAALLVLSVISSALKVDMPLGVGTSCISLSYAVDFTALLLLGPAPTMLIAVTSGWSQCTFRMGERNPAYKTLFSMATLAVSVAAAGAMYAAVGGTFGELPPAPLQSLMAAAMVYFLVNSLAVAAAFALSTGRGVYRVWHDNFLWTISTYVVGAIAAGIAVEAPPRLRRLVPRPRGQAASAPRADAAGRTRVTAGPWARRRAPRPRSGRVGARDPPGAPGTGRR